MNVERLKYLLLIIFFYAISVVVGIILSKKIAIAGLWFMPALFHLYPIITVSFVIIYSVITDQKVLWSRLLILLGIGLLLECLLFWLTRHSFFTTPKVMALFILGLLIILYGATWSIYIMIVAKKSS